MVSSTPAGRSSVTCASAPSISGEEFVNVAVTVTGSPCLAVARSRLSATVGLGAAIGVI